MSAVIEGLTHSQGSIALISVMLCGFAFQGFTVQEFDYDNLSRYHQIVYIAFSISTSLCIASFLFIAVSCTLLEQSGHVARALAIAYDVSPDFDVSLKNWYMDKTFSAFRVTLIQVFTGSFPLFALFVALFCVLKFPPVIGEVCAGIFLLSGTCMVLSVVRNNNRFVTEVLQKAKQK